MKINKKNSHLNKKIVIISSLLLVVLFGGVIYALTKPSDDQVYDSTKKEINSVNYDEPTDEQKQSGSTIKDDSINTEAGKESTGGSDQPPVPTPQENGKSIVEVMLTAPQNNTAYATSDMINFRFSISSEVSTGLCTLTLSKTGSSTLTKTAAPFQSGPTISTCKGFDVPASEMTTGTWKVGLVFENDTLFGNTTGSVIIK